MPTKAGKHANPQASKAIEYGIDYGSMILNEIPDLKDLELIMRNQSIECIDSETANQEINVYLFEFRLFLAQTYLAVCV
jgi:hypothetical protein